MVTKAGCGRYASRDGNNPKEEDTLRDSHGQLVCVLIESLKVEYGTVRTRTWVVLLSSFFQPSQALTLC